MYYCQSPGLDVTDGAMAIEDGAVAIENSPGLSGASSALVPMNDTENVQPRALHISNEFRAVTGLLALVASMNNAGTKKLQPLAEQDERLDGTRYDAYGRYRYANLEEETQASSTKPSARSALQAMATLLVRDGEVVACTVGNIGKQVEVIAMTDRPSRPSKGTLEEDPEGWLLTSLVRPPGIPTTDSDNGNVTEAEKKKPSPDGDDIRKIISACLNPRDGDNYFKDAPKKACIKNLVPTLSHWETLQTDRWAVLETK